MVIMFNEVSSKLHSHNVFEANLHTTKTAKGKYDAEKDLVDINQL